MKNKHYVVLPDNTFEGTFKVVCLAHDISGQLKRIEADGLANSLNLESCMQQEGFGAE
ncbi:hypothetical protein HU230_0012665 [Bradyrhizobium quebecense]|uniref:Uncharacterized protein n=1 Tax=Bradyrhizobium quebecense TaxID=2748629 RepID=A0A974AEM9_9BRAD|nr:hypothetical protein [Bradyrhizobium quebecense]UGA46842.1 hypothetical protein HU230_0012665 [Bradyrhizobium quebecense]